VIYEREQVRAIAEATVAWMRQCIAKGSPYVAYLNMPIVLAAWEAGQDGICRNAPHLVIAHAPEQLPSGSHTGAIAITYLELGAASLGVGTCWAGFVFVGAGASPDLHAALGLPQGQRCAGAVLAGRPALSHLRVPARRSPSIHWR
jgi:nitroreductase